MWGWGRNSKDDDSTSTGNNNNKVSGSSALGGFALPSPRSPMSLGGGPKKHTSFYGTKSGNGNKVSSSTNEQPNKQQHQRRRSWGGKDRRSGPPTAGEVLSAVTIMEKASSLHSSEAFSGIEVSLSQDKSVQRGTGAVTTSFVSASLAPAHKSIPTVAISLQQQLVERQKVYRAQFQSVISNGPTNSDGQSPASPLSTTSKQFDSSNFNKSKNHRLPLFDNKDPAVSYDDALFILKDYAIREEGQCVKDEIEQTDNEIAAIEHDRNEIEKRWIASKSFVAATTVESKDDINGVGDSSTSSPGIEWDTNRTLAVKKNLTSERIRELQLERGVSLTISLENPKALESLLSKCGGKATTNTPKSASKTKQNDNLITTMRPSNDKAADAACTIQQVCLMKTAGSETSFLISRDTGSAFFYGRLPDRLFRRMKNKSNGNGTGTSNIGRPGSVYDASSDQSPNARDILYLSTGPFGCYYSEFRSGECWWGLTADDDELDAIFNEWDVYKIAFGPCVTIEPSFGNAYKSTSWIVIARDGRAAWKNLPSRLHHKLSSRLANETSPLDVSLGAEGSYFVRFLDGSSDWQLPSRTAEMCKSLEKDGYQITSISLHPELSHDFIIRHR